MKYFLISFFLFSINCLSQKSYSFDYLIEYDFKSYSDSLSDKKTYYLTNSKENSYYVKLESLDTLNFNFEFIAQDRIWSKTTIPKSDFFQAQYINLDCNENLTYRNHFKFRTKKYRFEILPDTALKNSLLKNYRLQYIGKKKRNKSFPVGTNLYIIENSTNFHLPILTHSTAFEEWKEEMNIPNGIFKEKIFYDFNNEIKYKYILKKYYKIDKVILIQDDCLEK